KLLSLGGVSVDLVFGFLEIDAALEERAIFNAQAVRYHITGQSTFCTDVNAVADRHVAVKLSHHDDFLGIDVGGNGSVPSDGHPVIGKIDAALNAAVDVKRFGATHFALDDQRTADSSLLCGRAKLR